MPSSDVNQRILEKIDKSSVAPPVKTFLRTMRGYELEHFSEAMWRYNKVFEAEILKLIRE